MPDNTIQSVPHDACTGCSACVSVCPVSCITMVADAEGFLTPSISDAACTHCGLCLKICPVMRPPNPRTPRAVYAARALDDKLRLESSSGGIFTLLARTVLEEGGVVFGAGWSKDLRVVHQSAETEEELAALRGSKYVQSEIGTTFQQAQKELERGRLVLYSGTPCQIAGLKAFLQKDYSNLLCQDLICHAVPSPKVFQFFKEAIEKQYTETISAISFRDKRLGWKVFSLRMKFGDQQEYCAPLTEDLFLRGFLSELFNRPCCHQCAFRELRSGADITLADYWNVHLRFPELDDNLGTSVVLLNSQNGIDYFLRIKDSCRCHESDYQDIVQLNPSVVRSVPPHPKRSKFFKTLHKETDIGNQIRILLKRSFVRRCLGKAKSLLRTILSTK